MKRSLVFCVCVLFILVFESSRAQQTGNDNSKDSISSIDPATVILADGSSWPEFPGGRAEMMKFLSRNLIYPKDAEKLKIEGRVIIGFTILKDGAVAEVRVLRGVYPSLDEEALRVVRLMPQWKPGTSEGKPVNVKHKIDIVYRLPIKTVIYCNALSFDSSLVTSNQYPKFEGDKKGDFTKYVKKNGIYPSKAEAQRIKGTTRVVFELTKDKQITHIKVVESADPLLDEEAIRLIQQSGPWKSGRVNGKPIDVVYTAEIVFDWFYD